MKKIKTSLVAWSGLGAIISFGAIYYIIGYDDFLDVALSLAFGVSLAVVFRYAPDAWRAIRSGRAGGEFLIVALFSMAVILLIQRIWGITLRIYDRPDWLVLSPMTIFLPWMIAWALSLALVAPDVGLEDPREARSNLWRSAALLIGGALIGFLVAVSFRTASGFEVSKTAAWPQLANRAQCSENEPVWVSSKGVYHDVDSPYRKSIYPRHCFETVEDAQGAGFRPPKGIERNIQK